MPFSTSCETTAVVNTRSIKGRLPALRFRRVCDPTAFQDNETVISRNELAGLIREAKRTGTGIWRAPGIIQITDCGVADTYIAIYG